MGHLGNSPNFGPLGVNGSTGIIRGWVHACKDTVVDCDFGSLEDKEDDYLKGIK